MISGGEVLRIIQREFPQRVVESVFPFLKFPGVDILLGPEMKSTGEVMGVSEDFGIAFKMAGAVGISTCSPSPFAP